MATKTAKSKKTIKALSPSMNLIEKAICSNLKLKTSDEAVIGQEVPLQNIEQRVHRHKGSEELNVPKMCRRMRRAGILKYRWADDGKRYIGLTKKGFTLLNN